MSTPLRTLILEDQPADAELMVANLERAGLSPRWQRVETEREFTAALGPDLDLILADYQLANFDAVRALERVHECSVEAPFLVVSAAISESRAFEAMQNGAAAIVDKDRIAVLGPAVLRALEERRMRDALRQFERLSAHVVAAGSELAKLTPDCEKLSILAHNLAATPEQLAVVDTAAAAIRASLESRLSELLRTVSQYSDTCPAPADGRATTPHAAALLEAVRDTISVLEQTKRSFKSRTLSRLRERLEAILRANSSA